MKKTVIFVVLAMVLIGSCAAQSATTDQRIVGTWVCTYSDGNTETYVFNANGTGTNTYKGETKNIFWGITVSGEICISTESTNNGYYSKYAISPDGKRMFISSSMYQKK